MIYSTNHPSQVNSFAPACWLRHGARQQIPMNQPILSDKAAMQMALVQARLAAEAGEVPVGAVVLREGQVLAVGHNAPITRHDPSAHAEMLALRAAAAKLENYRLDDCELFVTLEPCTMCAGAMLHARLKRVVFGVSDPKTGAAGSVGNVFAMAQLNHQTEVQGGLLAAECATLLQDFFRLQRSRQQQQAAETGRALREDALRTPQQRFTGLSVPGSSSHHLSDLPSLAGLRLHYLDTGPVDASASWLCLHGPDQWSYGWAREIEAGAAQGLRVVCPDLIGFGRSDKPKKASFHRLDWHAQVLRELIERLGLRQITLITPQHALALAQRVADAAPQVVGIRQQTPPPLSRQALEAPFPDRGHQAALRAGGLFLRDPR